MDESIIRLRSWQLERQIAKEKLELNMADSLLLVSEQPSGLVDTVESDGREQVISDYLLHHNTQTRKTSASVKWWILSCLLLNSVQTTLKCSLNFLSFVYVSHLDGNY